MLANHTPDPKFNRNGGREVTDTERALDAAEVAGRATRLPQPKPEPEVAAKRAAKPKADKKPAGRKPGSKIILKANKEVRAALTAEAKKCGGSRLEPIGFDNYSAFLNGFERKDGGNLVQFKVPGQPDSVRVQLTIKGSDWAVTSNGGK